MIRITLLTLLILVVNTTSLLSETKLKYLGDKEYRIGKVTHFQKVSYDTKRNDYKIRLKINDDPYQLDLFEDNYQHYILLDRLESAKNLGWIVKVEFRLRTVYKYNTGRYIDCITIDEVKILNK